MGKLLGLPMGVDVCYTNHASADQNSADNLLLLLAAAGANYFMGVPCADDVMLNYQSTSFHDALAVRRLFGLRQAPEFAEWWETEGWCADSGNNERRPNHSRAHASAVGHSSRGGRKNLLMHEEVERRHISR